MTDREILDSVELDLRKLGIQMSHSFAQELFFRFKDHFAPAPPDEGIREAILNDEGLQETIAKEYERAAQFGLIPSIDEIAIAVSKAQASLTASHYTERQVEWLKMFFKELKTQAISLGIKKVGEPEKVTDWSAYLNPEWSAYVVGRLLTTAMNEQRDSDTEKIKELEAQSEARAEVIKRLTDAGTRQCPDCGGRKTIFRLPVSELGETSNQFPCPRCKGRGVVSVINELSDEIARLETELHQAEQETARNVIEIFERNGCHIDEQGIHVSGVIHRGSREQWEKDYEVLSKYGVSKK